MKYLVIMSMFILNSNTYSQMRLDGVYKKNIVDKRMIPYQKVEERDVFWSKRLWRIIDTREKQNLIFRYPQKPLIDIIHSAAKEGALSAYDNTVLHGDQFMQELEKNKVINLGLRLDTLWVKDPISFLDVPVITEEKLDYSKVYRYKIKEDWFFNSLTSTLEVRIIGIAPMMAIYDENNNYLGDETLYWIYYQDLRPILASHEAYNPGNFAQRLSWDDIFEARYFSSYIYKEDNVYDRPIQEYASRKDALYESERIKEEIFNFEHDLWEY